MDRLHQGRDPGQPVVRQAGRGGLAGAEHADGGEVDATVTLSSLDFSSRPTEDGAYAGRTRRRRRSRPSSNGTEVGTATAADGAATVTVTVPGDAAKGAGTLVLTTNTGTTVTLPVTVA